MSPIKTVLVAGASGNLGPSIVNGLIAKGIYEISALTRPSSSSTFPAPVKPIQTDYSPASLKSILSTNKYDAVISLLNVAEPSIAESQSELIKASKENGVKRFIPSEFGSDTANDEVSELVPIFGGKKAAVAHLKTLQGNDFTWSALVTGPFFDWGIKHNFISINTKEKKLIKWDDGKATFSVSTLATIGKAVANLLSDETKLKSTANRYVYIASHTVAVNDYIAAVQRATPTEKWTIEEVDSEQILKNATEAFKGGNHFAAYDLIKAFSFGKRNLGGFKNVSNDLLGLEKEDLEANIKAALA